MPSGSAASRRCSIASAYMIERVIAVSMRACAMEAALDQAAFEYAGLVWSDVPG
jgi:hypothetical protein